MKRRRAGSPCSSRRPCESSPAPRMSRRTWRRTGSTARDTLYFATARQFDPLRALASGEDGPMACRCGRRLPQADIRFDQLLGRHPVRHRRRGEPLCRRPFTASGVESVDVATAITATFSEWVDPQAMVFGVTALSGAGVAGTTVYDPVTSTARFTPNAPLAAATVHTATISGAVDNLGIRWPRRCRGRSRRPAHPGRCRPASGRVQLSPP